MRYIVFTFSMPVAFNVIMDLLLTTQCTLAYSSIIKENSPTVGGYVCTQSHPHCHSKAVFGTDISDFL